MISRADSSQQKAVCANQIKSKNKPYILKYAGHSPVDLLAFDSRESAQRGLDNSRRAPAMDGGRWGRRQGRAGRSTCPHPRLDGWETTGQHYELLGVAG